MSSSLGGTAGIRKQIRSQLIKMGVVMLLMVATVILARDFVVTGLLAKLYLNGAIWLVFLYGVAMAFRTVFSLKNDELAFAALVETYDDFKQNEHREAEDPYWRHYKCLEPATVYGRPRILGHFYEIVFEELLRTRKLRVSVGTMQSLVHGVEQRLAEERSLVLYLSGLLVFMGLIGAFIGLMQTVGSVGNIIGSLGANPGGGSNSSMFSKLVGDLQGPLKGMSVGFSSSLFGLGGSLILGLMARLSNHAATVMKVEFEGWLANVAQIEDESDDNANASKQSARAGVAGAVFGMDGERAKIANRALESMAKSMNRSVELLETIAETQRTQQGLLVRSADALDLVATRQDQVRADVETITSSLGTVMAEGFKQTGSVIETLSSNQMQISAQLNTHQQQLVAALEQLSKQQGLTEDVRRLGRSFETAMSKGFADVGKVLETAANTHNASLREMAMMEAKRRETADSDMMFAGTASLPALVPAIEAGLARGLADVARSVDLASQRTQASIDALLARPPGATGDLSAVRADLRNMGDQIEAGLRDGLIEMSRSFEQAFQAYADMLRHLPAHGMPAMPVMPEPEQEPQEKLIEDRPEAFVDHQEMMMRLRSAAAKTLKGATG